MVWHKSSWLETGRTFPDPKGALAMKPFVADALWERLQPLLPPPPERRFRFPGRKPLDYRQILTGILFVLKTGIAWEDLPAELGCGCGKTCRHYLRLWHQAGVWRQLHALLLAELNDEWHLVFPNAIQHLAFGLVSWLHQTIVGLGSALSSTRLETVGPAGDPVRSDGIEQVLIEV